MSSRRWVVAAVTAAGLAAAAPAAASPGAVASPRAASSGTASSGPAASSGSATPTTGKQVDASLGNGLGRLLAQSEAASGAGAVPRGVHGLRVDQSALAIRDSRARVLVDTTPAQGADAAAYRRQAERLGMTVTAVDSRSGVLEGFVPLNSVRPLAGLESTGTIAMALKPRTAVGAVTSQGVQFQRVDKVLGRGVDGRGVTIGALSDSYDTATTTIPGAPLTDHAKDDVASGDLPGRGNRRYSQPVAVLQDYPGADAFDEGRAMLQIAHDVAPAAKLCFATAFAGDIGFANNIRALADRKGKCRAGVVVDDVGYFDEPFFSDGPISDAVDDVAAQGVSYVSSAGNSGDSRAGGSKVSLLPASVGADGRLKGTNLDFGSIDHSLYDGGLQDMNPGRGVDVAQTLSLTPNGGVFDLQWDDPVDFGGVKYGAPYYSTTGAITGADPKPSFHFTPAAGQVGKLAQFRTDAIPSGTTDLVLTVIAPDGKTLATVDTGTSPETFSTKLVAGTYTVVVSGFAGATGDFTLDVRPILSLSKTTTDFNVLMFGPDGAYLGALADANRLSGRPFEISSLAGVPEIQIVIARAGTGRFGATRLRLALTGGIYVSEYSDPLAPAIYGHPAAKGATAVAAYDPFRPYLPEPFTSPGGVLPIFFDSGGNRYPAPQLRRVPQIASTDGGNTTFFVADSALDADTWPNFFGTSAAAPHAAAIAALLLQHAGGPRSLTPDQVRARLERSTFVHDLDPDSSGGGAAGLTVTASGPQGDERDPDPAAMTNPRFFTIRYTGTSPLRSITFYGETASPTALRASGLNGGIVFDPRAPAAGAPPRDSGFPFTVGATGGGVRHGDVRASFSVPAGGLAPAGVYRHMTITFAQGLPRGGVVQFGVDRDLADPAPGLAPREGNGADELGGATFLPQDVPEPSGMVFSATRADGRTFVAVMTNRLGRGWRPLDGFGVVDAQQAVLGH